LIIEYRRPNRHIVGKLTTDVVTYCTEASIKNQNMRTGKYCFTKKALDNGKSCWNNDNTSNTDFQVSNFAAQD